MPTVVVLLSDKRSGSTMVQEELCRHSAIRHVAYSPHTNFETHHWLKAAVVLRRPQALYSGGRTYGGYGSRRNARTYLVDTLKGNIPGYVPPQDDRTLVFQGWEALCRQYAEPIFFEKSPQVLAHWAALGLFLDWVERTEMNVRVIGLVRNPLAVQYSALEIFSTEPEVRQFGWLEIQRNLMAVRALLPAEMFKLVRYEDLIAAPAQAFSDLCEFIGVPPEAGVGSGAHSNSRERWMEDANFTLQLDPFVVQVAKAFGYSSSELENPRMPTLTGAGSSKLSHQRRIRRWLTRRQDRMLRPAYLRIRSAFGAKE